MTVRRWLAAVLVTVSVLGAPAAGRAHETTSSEEAGYALAALGMNLVYVPAKIVVAAAGSAVGAVVGLFTGGDVRSAYAIWVPTASGTYILRAANIDGSEPIEFFGSDYADEPSPLVHIEGGEGGKFYESLYVRSAPRSDR